MTARIDPRTALGLIAAGIMLSNLVNLVGWSLGLYLPPAVYLLWLALLLPVLIGARSNGAAIALLSVCFTLILLGAPTIDWDARSIWFFHAKRIFFERDLYATLDGYAAWSHNAYPPLVPALAASIARSAGFWNDTLPRLSVLMAVLPPVLLFARSFERAALFNTFIGAVLLIGGNFILNGYMDGLVALYVAAACLLLAPAWGSRRRLSPLDCVLAALLLASLVFIKNEGLVAALILWLLLLPRLPRRVWAWLVGIAPFVLFYALWQYPLALHDIGNGLTATGAPTRALHRLGNGGELALIARHLALQGGAFATGLALLLWLAKRSGLLLHLLPMASFALLQGAAVFMAYMISPYPLEWHLQGSAHRALMPVNLCILAAGFYFWSLWRAPDVDSDTSPDSRSSR